MIEDDVLEYIENNKDTLNIENILHHVKKILKENDDENIIKLAFVLYNGLGVKDEEIDNIVILFAHTGTMSYFCFPIIDKLEDKNEIYKEIIKNSEGYAKVEAVNHYEPEAKEDERWLLHNGTDGFLSYYRSAGPISIKCHILDMIKDSNLCEEDYEEICRVVSMYYSESSAVGLKYYDKREETMLALIDLAYKRRDPAVLYAMETILHYERDMFINEDEKKRIIDAAKAV